MANNNTTSTKETKTTNKSTTVKELEKRIAEQQEQIKQLMSLIQTKEMISTVTAINNNDIGADEEILVISLTPNRLNLIGSGGIVLFSFDNMYEEQYIDYASLKEIVRLNREMAKNGRFYIVDERAVNKLRLKNNYKNVLSPEQLKKILTVNFDKAVELYKLANKAQKEIIIELVKQSKFNGDSIDYNLLNQLSELSGVDLMNIEDATQIDMDVER